MTKRLSFADKLRRLADAEEGDALDDPERAELLKLVDAIFLNSRIEDQVIEMNPGLRKRTATD